LDGETQPGHDALFLYAAEPYAGHAAPVMAVAGSHSVASSTSPRALMILSSRAMPILYGCAAVSFTSQVPFAKRWWISQLSAAV
jgi:hypothetical protein